MKKILLSLMIAVTGTLFISCDINTVPLNNLSEASYFNTPDDYKLFANRFYLGLPTLSDVDAMTDLGFAWSINSVSNGSYIVPEYDAVWTDKYSLIRRTNELLAKIEKADSKIKPQLTVYEGEARFFRAFFYFNLMTRFGGVPLVDKVLDLDSPEIYGPRNTRAEVINFIMDDLDKAIPLLPEQSELAVSDLGRITKSAVLGFQARAALYEGTWRKFHNEGDGETLLQKAIDDSKILIQSKQYELFDRRDVLGDSSYRYFFVLDKIKSNPTGLTKADNKEYILVHRYDQDMTISPLSHYPAYGSCPTQKLVDMFLCNDGLPIEKSPKFQGKNTCLSEYQNRDPRMTQDLYKPFQRYWSNDQTLYNRNWDNPLEGGQINNVQFSMNTSTGYLRSKFWSENIYSSNSWDYPIIRLAEVMLIYAEASYEKNGAISDADLDISINKLRDRVGMPHLTNSFVSSNGLDMRTEIRRERNVELLYESIRWDDLCRWKTAETEMPMSLRGIKFTGTQYQTDPLWARFSPNTDAEGYYILENASARKFDAKQYLFPIPSRQILLNPKLKQNPGWE